MGFGATDTISVLILVDDPAPPAPHAGTFTVPPGNVASFSNVNLNSCNDLTLVVVGSDGSSLQIADNTSGDECPGPVTPVVTQTVANNTLDPITLHVDLEDDSCGATYGSDHTGTGNASGADHALTTEVDSTSFEVDLLDGGAGCGRVADEAIPQVNDGDAQVDISISPSVLATGIWIVPDGWTARFDQFFVSGCDNGTTGHLVVDGVDTYTQACFSNTPPSTLVNTSGATKLVQFVLEDVTCGVRYSTSHTSDGATSVDHAMIWDVGSGNYQVAITNAGASCENEDVNSVPGIGGGDFVPFIAVYQSPCC
jgi:hypothetical protein